MSQEGTMPKNETTDFPSFDDWDAPFDPDEVDGEKALRLIYQIRKDEHRLKARLAKKDEKLEETEQALTVFKEAAEAAEREGESETDALKRQIEALQKKIDEKPAENLEAARLRIALKYNLTERQANRLVGDDVEALEEDAEALIEELGLNKNESESQREENDHVREEEPDAELRRRPRGRAPLDPKPDAGPAVDPIKDIDALIPRGG